MKSEPFVYSFDRLLADGKTTWEGVRNFEARNTMRAMKTGDTVLYYHSNEGKEIVGVAKVVRAAFQDPTTDEDWAAVEIAGVEKLARPIGLPEIKAHALLSKMLLVRRSRISVVAVTPAELSAVLALAQKPAKAPAKTPNRGAKKKADARPVKALTRKRAKARK
jgi:predicted RNA-binding protein with PUA-like domain